MHAYKPFAVVGGDLRQTQIANRLAARGEEVYALLLEENAALDSSLRVTQDIRETLSRCKTVILPLPLSADDRTVHTPFSRQRLTLENCFDSIGPGARVFAGKVGDSARKMAKQRGIGLIDYLQREELAVLNAAITAEGAISIAIEELPIALFGATVLVTGHGRIARALLRILPAFGAKAVCAARKFGDLAEERARGLATVTMQSLDQAAEKADLIFNTAPAMLFNRAMLEYVKPGALLIDLASKPGGCDLCFA